MRGAYLIPAMIGAVFLFAVMNASEADAWYNNNWQYRQEIQIDNAFVENADFDNFPVPIVITLDNAKTMDNGDDILFTDNIGDVLIPFEIENWNTTDLIAWVKVPTLMDTENTIIYVYYGNASATSMDDSEGTWDSNYIMVHHLYDNQSGADEVTDSTSYGNDGDKNNTVLENVGKIGYCEYVNGTNDGINVGSDMDNSIAASDELTFSAWVQGSETGLRYVLGNDQVGGAGDKNWGQKTTGRHSIIFREDGGGTWREYVTTVWDGTWNYITATYDQSDIILWENGGDIGLTINVGLNLVDEGTDWGIGFRPDGAVSFRGNIDEVRVSDVARSGNYMRTSYLLEDDPAGAITTGTEEVVVIPIAVDNVLSDNFLLDNDIQWATSGVVTTTRIGVDVEIQTGNSISLDNIYFEFYDAADTLIDNKVATENSFVSDNKQRYFVAFDSTDNVYAPAALGGFDMTVGAHDNAGETGTTTSNNLFYVDEPGTSVTSENVAGHRIKLSGTLNRVSGEALTTPEDVFIVDNNIGTFQTILTGNNWENTRQVFNPGQYYLQLKTENLDGVVDNVAYTVPNLDTEIVYIAVDNSIIDRDIDDVGSPADPTAIIYVFVRDNDNRDDIVTAWIAIRDNADVIRDNQDVFSTASAVDENTYRFTLTVNPADNIPDSALGVWDVHVRAGDNFDNVTNDWGNNNTRWLLDDMEDGDWTGDWDLIDNSLYTEGAASLRIRNNLSPGTETFSKYFDLSGANQLRFDWRYDRSNVNDNWGVELNGTDVFSYTGGDQLSFVLDENIDVSAYGDNTRIEFFVYSASAGNTNFHVDKLLGDGLGGENLFIVADLDTTVTFNPASPHYRWDVATNGRVFRIDDESLHPLADNVFYRDTTETESFNFTNNDNWQTDNYEVATTLPSGTGETRVIIWDTNPGLDGIRYENYSVNENWRFQVNLYYEDNFEWIPDNAVENVKNIRAEFYFAAYETQHITLTENDQLIDLPFEPRLLRVRDLDNNYFRTYRTTGEEIDVYLVADNNIANVFFYTVALDDPTGIWGPPNGYIIFYTFNEGTPVFINDAYWGGTNDTTAYLIFANIYNIRLGAPSVNDLDWGTFDADANTSRTITPTQITPGDNVAYVPITSSIAWGFTFDNDNDLIITYEDNTDNTTWVAIYIFDENDVQLWFDNNASSSFTAQWTAGGPENFYMITLEIEHELFGSLSSTDLWVGFEITPNLPDDDPFSILGGPSGIWGDLAVCSIMILALLSFGPKHAGVGGIVAGIIGGLIVATGMIGIDVEIIALIIMIGFIIEISESKGGTR